MFKKLVYIVIALLMLFSLAACQDFDLAAYKNIAKVSLETYAQETRDNYCADNWMLVCNIVTEGKAAIDDAKNKPAVDTAVETAKQEIDAVSEGNEMIKQGVYITDDEIGRIELYGDNLFRCFVVYISHVPTGTYAIINGRLILYASDFELIFDIESDKIIFIGAYFEGEQKDFFIQSGVIFKFSDGVEIFEQETEDMIELYNVPTSTGVSLIAIALKDINDNSIFECTIDEGYLFLQGQLVDKNMSIIACTTISWMPVDIGTDGKSIPLQIEKAFVDVILKVGDNITGYGVIDICKTENSNTHAAQVLKSVLFPKIDGNYQNITEEYVKTAIYKIKNYELYNLE